MSGSVKLSITNPNAFAVRVTTVTGTGAITSDKGAACDAATGVTFANQTGLTLALASPAYAGWDSGGSGSAAAARSLPGGNAPSGSALLGTVTLSWSASSFAGGGAVPSYVIRRFNALTGTEAAVGNGCSGLVSATSCTESGVTPGSWKYTVTPAAGAWRGGRSAQSSSILVL